MAENCILIPTYNNAASLSEVIAGASVYGIPVIVVNDGSTDNTSSVLNKFPSVERIDFKDNCGKGRALEAGFKTALRLGCKRVVTIDSDLQHDPFEIRFFLEAAQKYPDALVVGNRDMEKGGAPFRNRFGLAMSNLYVRFLTAGNIPDTQSGFRLYPVGPILDLCCEPSRFEYEFMLLVAAVKSGMECVSIPITVSYNPDNYVTHFRPVVDFMRIFKSGLGFCRIPFSGKLHSSQKGKYC